MVHNFIIAPQTYISFENEAEQIEKCKEWSLLSEKAIKSKAFFYKRNGVTLPCSIVGYVDKLTAVISFENDQKHCIHPSYLKEMQAANYGQKAAAAVEDALTLENEAAPEHENEAAVEFLTADEPEAAQSSPAGAELPVIEPKTEAAPKAKTKKEKKPKLDLPEGKVKMVATVKEFTTVPNNFSDTEDEVVIYEAVSIVDPDLAIGDAWSSHSATLKKLELEIGDILHFEGKVVAKKLTKHPIPYKINNPAKIQKEKPE